MNAGAVEAGPIDRYRTRARRLRAAYRSNPVRLQQALGDLARGRGRETPSDVRPTPQRPTAPTIDWSGSAVIGPRAGEARRFADLVAHHLGGPVLPYPVRTKLLREASRRGIGRFEANLIIAAVQHQMGHLSLPSAGHLAERPARRQMRIAGAVAAFAFVQGMIVLAAWWVLG